MFWRALILRVSDLLVKAFDAQISYYCFVCVRFSQVWVSGVHTVLILLLIEYFRFIPEFISRLPSITTLAPLTIPDLLQILTGVKGSLLSQYKALFQYSNVDIRFTSAANDEICRQAYERGGGARGLRGIMVSIQFSLTKYSYTYLCCRKHYY